jgi:threonine synthase
VPDTGFVSGRSTDRDRLQTIRQVHERYGVLVDPHTADGLKVGLAFREAGVPMVCLETALPVKFAATIRKALGREPERPTELADQERRAQRCEVIAPDLELLKRYIAAHAIA